MNNLQASVDLAAFIYDWLLYIFLALNPDKSEACTFGVSCRVQSLKSTIPVTVAGVLMTLSDHIKSLGVTTGQHTRHICKILHFHVRGFRQVRGAMDHLTANAVACTVVGSRPSYTAMCFWPARLGRTWASCNVSRTALIRW